MKLIAITQEMGDDPMPVMMRQIMALFDEYQSKENAKHVLRVQKENARQGFWNGSLPPIGCRVVSDPTLLTGICFCAECGGAMTLRTVKGGWPSLVLAPRPIVHPQSLTPIRE